jgi:hypothetical protein
VSFFEFCHFIFKKYPSMEGNLLLSMCEVAYREIVEEENGGNHNE